MGGNAPVWKKSLYDKYGGFNEKEYSGAADFDLWLRFFKKEGKFKKLDKSYVIFYHNPNSYGEKNNLEKEHLKLVKNHLFLKNYRTTTISLDNKISYFMEKNFKFGNHYFGWNFIYNKLVNFLKTKYFSKINKPLFFHPWLDCYNSWGWRNALENSLLHND